MSKQREEQLKELEGVVLEEFGTILEVVLLQNELWDRNEPPRVSRKVICLSQAAIADSCS